MALAANATFTLTDYTIPDSGVQLHFVCANPGPSQVTDYIIVLTDTEISSVSTVADFKALVTTKLQRRYRTTALSTKLDGMVGQSVTI
jgi:hypothetical protein